MELITAFETTSLNDTRTEIKQLQVAITPYAGLKIFPQLDAKFKSKTSQNLNHFSQK